MGIGKIQHSSSLQDEPRSGHSSRILESAARRRDDDSAGKRQIRITRQEALTLMGKTDVHQATFLFISCRLKLAFPRNRGKATALMLSLGSTEVRCVTISCSETICKCLPTSDRTSVLPDKRSATSRSIRVVMAAPKSSSISMSYGSSWLQCATRKRTLI